MVELTNAGRPSAAPHALRSQEHRIDLLQAGVETLGNREIPPHDIDVGRQTRCVRIASHRTKLGARSSQLIDDVTPDVSSGAGDEDSIHG
jgi:hypothetical protein